MPAYVRPPRWGRFIGELTKKDSALPKTYIDKFNYWVRIQQIPLSHICIFMHF